MQLERLSIEDLKVGDMICIPYTVRGGWTTFRYPSYKETMVKRITPKKTKLVTSENIELDRYSSIYRPNEETRRRTKVAKAFDCVYHSGYARNNNKPIDVHNLGDETLIKLSVKLKEISAILESEEKED